MMAAIDRRAWLTASGVGIGLAFLVGVTSIVLSRLGPDVTDDPQAVLSSPVYLLITCLGLLAYIIYAVVGLVYAWQVRQGGASMSAGSMAVGGLASALTVLAFQFVLALVNALIISRDTMNASLGQLRDVGISIPAASEPLYIVGVLCFGTCFAFVIGGALGAGAAAIYATVAGPRQTPGYHD